MTILNFLPALVYGFNGKATFYNNPNFAHGSCGFGFSDSEFIAALSGDMMHGYKAPHCNRMARVNYKGKSVTVKIADTCPGCEKTSLDLSPAAFQALEHLDVGLIDIQWDFLDGLNQTAPQSEPKQSDNGKQDSHQQHRDNDQKDQLKDDSKHIPESKSMHEGTIFWTENPKGKGGICGVPYSDNDFVAVISKQKFDSAKCGQSITVYAGDKKTKVKVVDTCEACDQNSLVLSKTAFKVFNDLGKGMFMAKWEFTAEEIKSVQKEGGPKKPYSYRYKDNLDNASINHVQSLSCIFLAFLMLNF